MVAETHLSPREVEIAQAYAGGQSYLEIAEHLGLAPSTVRTHLSTIYRKLGVSSKLELRDALTEAPTQSPPDPPQTARAEKPSIAVLAFENMSGDPEQEFFSDGITDDIITALSRSPWLFVIARNTTFTYKGANVDIRRVAQDLGVRFVLEGSARRAGDRVRVSAQLIDGLTGGLVWSDRYDGEMKDVFDLQDEITRSVVASILTTVHLSTIPEPIERSSRPNVTVWELTMRAWHLVYDFTPESFAHAKTLLERALAIDPESAEANMVLSVVNHHSAIMGFTTETRAAMEAAYALGRRAIQLDERNEYAHWAFGISCWGLLKFDESLPALERAVALNPNCSAAFGSLGTLLSKIGRPEEAIVNHEIAIRSNPLDPSIFFRFSGLAFAHYTAGRFETAIEWAERAIHRNPRWFWSHFILAASHVALDQIDAAARGAAACEAAIPGVSIADMDRIPFQDPAGMEVFCQRLAAAGFPAS